MFRKKGFTLLELIIVIIVIGILASIALPRYIRVTEKARTAEAKSGLATLRSAQLRYYAQYGNYTANITSTDAELTTAKYFDIITQDGSGGTIARATRNTVEPVLGGYYIEIDVNGILNISDPLLNYLL